MAAQTYKPSAIAREASRVMGRTVTEKQVRGIARDTLARFDKTAHPAYQSHEYTADERKRLMAVFTARAGKGRKVAPSKPRAARKPRVAPIVATSESSDA